MTHRSLQLCWHALSEVHPGLKRIGREDGGPVRLEFIEGPRPNRVGTPSEFPKTSVNYFGAQRNDPPVLHLIGRASSGVFRSFHVERLLTRLTTGRFWPQVFAFKRPPVSSLSTSFAGLFMAADWGWSAHTYSWRSASIGSSLAALRAGK